MAIIFVSKTYAFVDEVKLIAFIRFWEITKILNKKLLLVIK
ncbi:hypothetical protein HMPREF3230_00295 [Gardnerella vaginalis]|uniref:Uncharacterized protein n=1 Tax=Gardnerella vaginalis TaxID=2702 RepID=A0A135ZA62_GARVA|nr:hypothetical protein HMPREF3230_00295 [Gardnerella vaginalis]